MAHAAEGSEHELFNISNSSNVMSPAGVLWRGSDTITNAVEVSRQTNRHSTAVELHANVMGAVSLAVLHIVMLLPSYWHFTCCTRGLMQIRHPCLLRLHCTPLNLPCKQMR
jgi:hypothetical protein